MKLGLRGIHHIGISVPSLQAAKVFYVDTLGFAITDESHFSQTSESDAVLALQNAETDVLMLKAGNIFLEIFEFQSPEPATQSDRPVCDHGYTHFALEVEDVQQAYSFLKSAGVSWHHPPIEAGEGYLMTYGRDPFGNVIEIQQLVAGEAFSFEQLKADACESS